jgi:predicted DNA-binding transcriptional regulator YafY
MSPRSQRSLRTKLRVFAAICESERRGHSVRELTVELGLSQATVFRTLSALEDAGVEFEKKQTGGVLRRRVVRLTDAPRLRMDEQTRTALLVARRGLPGISQSFVAAVLDALIEQCVGGHQLSVDPVKTSAVEEAVLRAITQRKRLRFRVTGPAHEELTVEPRELALKRGRLVLLALSVETGKSCAIPLNAIDRPLVLYRDPCVLLPSKRARIQAVSLEALARSHK